MVEGGPIDVLTGDYLAELTMALLWRSRLRDPEAGYASTFLKQMEQVLGVCLDRGIKVVVNAGGLNPAGMASKLQSLAAGLGLEPHIGYVHGDDVLDRLPQLVERGIPLTNIDTGVDLADASIRPVTANAYLGGWGIADALDRGADVVITGRVTDAAVVIGPAAWRFGWRKDDWDRLAGALVAGHIIECGAQATGGNFSFFRDVPDLDHVGFPIAEMHEDGSFVVTKHPGTGGLVSVGTVTEQLLYESAGPRYVNPDVIARFDTIELRDDGPDRVAVSGIEGEAAPADLKVAINHMGGFRNAVTFVLTGLDIEEKAERVERALWRALGGRDRFAESDVHLIRTDRPDAETNERASAWLRVSVKDPDEQKVGRSFSRVAVELALASYPGFHLTAPPSSATPYAVYWPALMPAGVVRHVSVVDGEERVIEHPPSAGPVEPVPEPNVGPFAVGDTLRAPLGRIVGARSGDKGGNANVGLWTTTDEAFRWLVGELDAARFRELVPEARDLDIDRYVFANLRAVNFVVHGLLGEGVSSSTRSDPQAKSLGEWIRSRHVDIPTALL